MNVQISEQNDIIDELKSNLSYTQEQMVQINDNMQRFDDKLDTISVGMRELDLKHTKSIFYNNDKSMTNISDTKTKKRKTDNIEEFINPLSKESSTTHSNNVVNIDTQKHLSNNYRSPFPNINYNQEPIHDESVLELDSKAEYDIPTSEKQITKQDDDTVLEVNQNIGAGYHIPTPEKQRPKYEDDESFIQQTTKDPQLPLSDDDLDQALAEELSELIKN
jgi:uncharacterized coiled-coil protein SlyX